MTRTLRNTLILAALGVVALFAGWQFGTPSQGGGQKTVAPGTLVFPGLAAKLQSAEIVTITTKAQTLDIIKKDGIWGLANRGGYPVQQDRLRELLTGLTELRVTEPRTADPAQYARLGVDDPNLPITTANLIRVLDGKGTLIAELIVGHRRVRTSGTVPESIYIRRPGEAQSWLAEGRLPADADPQLWFDRDITNIRKNDVATVLSTRIGATPLEFGRDGDILLLKSPAEHPRLDEYRLEDVFRGLESLTLTDVKPLAASGPALPGEPVGTAVYTTTDGMTVTVTVHREDVNVWASFKAEATGDAKPKAEALQKRIGPWAYQVGSWKEKSFVPTLDELKSTEPDPDAKPDADKPATAQPDAAQPDATKPDADKPADAKPADAKPGDGKPEDGKPEDAKKE